MPTVLNRTPQGVTVLQDDGSVVTLPPEMAPQDAGSSFVDQSGAPPSGPAPDSAPPPAPPVDVGPPPAQDQVQGAPGAAPATAPLPPPSAEQSPPPVAPASAAAPPPPPPTIDPAAPPTIQQSQAVMGGASAAWDSAQAQAKVKADTNAAIAPLEAQRQDERAKESAGLSASIASADAAAKAQANYDMRAPKSTGWSSAARVIAIMMGAIGQTLSKQGGPNPVLAILQSKAEEAARERMGRYSQLGQVATQKREGTDEIRKTMTGNEAQYHAHVAAVLAAYDREGERQAKLAGATSEAWAATATAAGLRQKYDEEVQKAGAEHWKQEKEAGELKVAQTNARTAQWNAGTEAGKLKEDVKEHGVANVFKAANYTLELQKQLSGTPAEQAAAMKDITERTPPSDVAVIRDAKGNPTGATEAKPILNGDGKRWLYPSGPLGDKLREKMADTKRFTDSLHAMEELRGANGAEMFKTGAARQAWVEFSNAQAVLKDKYKVRGFSDGAMEVMGHAIGTSNPNELDALDGIDEGFHQAGVVAARDLYTDMHAFGNYNGKPLEFANPNTLAPGTVNEEVKSATASATKALQDRPALSGGRFAANADTTVGDFARGAVAGKVMVKPITPEAGATVDDIAAKAKAGDLEARAALAQLVKGPNSAYARAKAAWAGVNLSEYGVK